MLFHPAATVLCFSRRDDEASHLLDRLRGMYDRLPSDVVPLAKRIDTSNSHTWEMSNGSVAYGFPTTAGDSYTASLAIVDEADLIPGLGKLMNAVKPTIDGGGQMVLLSRPDKDEPESTFKRIYRAAAAGKSPWKPVFVPWDARPERDAVWYERQKQDVYSRTGSLDDLYQQYPATPEEALLPRTLNKRIPPQWIEACYEPRIADENSEAPAIGGLDVFVPPISGGLYVIGADPAEGNPTSDDSSLHVVDQITGEEVACLADKIQPTVLGANIQAISEYYNWAPALVERNNHGHAVISWLLENTSVNVLTGWDGKHGWLTNTRGKALMWTIAADQLRDQGCIIHSEPTYFQLTQIEGATLSAPENMHDDRAFSFALAISAKESVSLYADGGIHV